MASEKEASAEDGFAGSRVILPSGCDVRRDAEWPVVGMETRLSEHLPRLPADLSGENALPLAPTHVHMHTHTHGQVRVHSAGALGLCAKRHRTAVLLSLSVK